MKRKRAGGLPPAPATHSAWRFASAVQADLVDVAGRRLAAVVDAADLAGVPQAGGFVAGHGHPGAASTTGSEGDCRAPKTRLTLP
ncbi:MAG: hypothetical protein WC030_01330 [Candidatus Paceibacterota bacterium]